MLTTDNLRTGNSSNLVRDSGSDTTDCDQSQCKPSLQCSLGNIKFKKNFLELENEHGNLTKVCFPIKATAYVRWAVEPKVSVLLKFKDDLGDMHTLLVPKAECKDSKRLIERLINCGWDFCCSKKTVMTILDELLGWSCPQNNLQRVALPGWHRNGENVPKVFIYGDRVFVSEGKPSKVYFAGNSPIKKCGTLDEWQQNVAKLFVGNSRQILFLSAAFAGPLLELVKQPNIGLLLHGLSRSGKTATLAAICSVFGDKGFMGNWKATANALLHSASERNDLIFPLDELSQAKASDAGDAAYDLMNGVSKARLSADIKMQDVLRFRLVTISTGEQSFTSYLAKHGLTASNGQLARMVSIPFSSKGVFEQIHGYKDDASFATALATNASTYFGTAGPKFIQYLVDHQRDIEQSARDRIDEIQDTFIRACADQNETVLQLDVAKRLATIAYAGELAIEIGILPFDVGVAIRAACTCFRAWGRQYEMEAATRDPVFAAAKSFITDQQASFISLAQHRSVKSQTIGFTHTVDGVTAFLLTPPTFQQQLCIQHGKQALINALKSRNLLMLGARGTPTRQITLPGSKGGKQSFYVINSNILRAG